MKILAILVLLASLLLAVTLAWTKYMNFWVGAAICLGLGFFCYHYLVKAWSNDTWNEPGD